MVLAVEPPMVLAVEPPMVLAMAEPMVLPVQEPRELSQFEREFIIHMTSYYHSPFTLLQE
jgi:hypothetical protein